MNSLAIIPARGGSKRIPHKNIKDFLGKPIISYPISAAIKSGCFDEVMVSTDSEEIANITRSFGASAPFLRSQINSTDYATTADVIEEVLLAYQKIGKKFSFFCCLYPTAVFVTSELIKRAESMLKEGIDGVATFTPYDQPIERAFQINGSMIMIKNPQFNRVRTQDLTQSYHDAAQLYFLKVAAFLEEKTMFPNSCRPIIIPSSVVQDIDTLSDWVIAERKYKYNLGSK